MLRYLVPLVTMMVLLGRSVMTFAAAGPVVDVHCCCPDPSTCKCQHGKGGGTEPTMKRCAGGQHENAPDLQTAAIAEVPVASDVPRVPEQIVHLLVAPPADRSIVHEKPPF